MYLSNHCTHLSVHFGPESIWGISMENPVLLYFVSANGVTLNSFASKECLNGIRTSRLMTLSKSLFKYFTVCVWLVNHSVQTYNNTPANFHTSGNKSSLPLITMQPQYVRQLPPQEGAITLFHWCRYFIVHNEEGCFGLKSPARVINLTIDDLLNRSRENATNSTWKSIIPINVNKYSKKKKKSFAHYLPTQWAWGKMPTCG